MAEAAETTAAAAKPYRRIQYAVLGREGLEFKLGPGKKRNELVDRDDPDTRFGDKQMIADVKDFEYAPGNGATVAVLQRDGVSVLNNDSGMLICRLERAGIMRMALSPLGTYLLTWEKHTGGDEGNLILWRVSDGSIQFQAVEKNLLATTWPTVQFTPDESVAAHMVTNTVRFFEGGDFSQPKSKLRFEDISQFALAQPTGAISEENPVSVAVFKPEKKGQPAKVSVFAYPNGLETPTAGKTFFKAQECKFKWAPDSKAVLVKTETDVDTTGQSYYGETALYLLHAQGGFDCKILPSKEGAFHDFAWSPAGQVFVAIAGKSPASSMLYDMKGEAVFDFGQAHRNTILFSPHGRFLALGGFGNLSGDMDFWDMNKKAKMGSVRANCAVTQEWSPCGRFMMTATLFPRMRVDNGMSFFTYRGDELFNVGVREASKALWRPAEAGVYADRPPTPLKVLRRVAKKAAEAGNPTAAVVPPPKPAEAPKRQAYRPPGSDGSLAAKLRQERASSSAPRALVPGGPVGAPEAKPQKSKAALRRERKKKAAEAAAKQ